MNTWRESLAIKLVENTKKELSPLAAVFHNHDFCVWFATRCRRTPMSNITRSVIYWHGKQVNVTNLRAAPTAGLGLIMGDYIRNKKTHVRGDFMGFCSDTQIKVIRHPADIQGGITRWQIWDIVDIERMPTDLDRRNEGLNMDNIYQEDEECRKRNVAKMGDEMQDIVNKICGTLPEGFEISLCMENGAAWVTLHESEGERVELPDTADTTIVQQLNAALCVVNGFVA